MLVLHLQKNNSLVHEHKNIVWTEIIFSYYTLDGKRWIKLEFLKLRKSDFYTWFSQAIYCTLYGYMFALPL